jgi:hypothetical protein
MKWIGQTTLAKLRNYWDTPRKIGSCVFVDNVSGDDTEGRRGDPIYAFESIQAALNAALAGDLVIVRPGTGTYVATGGTWTLKDGVSILSDITTVLNSNLLGTLILTGVTLINVNCPQTVRVLGGIINAYGCKLPGLCDANADTGNPGNFLFYRSVVGTVNGANAAGVNGIASNLSVLGLDTGSGASLDAVSCPPAAAITLAGGSTLLLKTAAHGVDYVPLNPAKWPAPPTSVSDALDQLQGFAWP